MLNFNKSQKEAAQSERNQFIVEFTSRARAVCLDRIERSESIVEGSIAISDFQARLHEIKKLSDSKIDEIVIGEKSRTAKNSRKAL